MENRAQITTPYQADIFTQLNPGQLATFTDNGAPANFYKVTPDGSRITVLIPVQEFNKHFKYMIQTTIQF